MNVNNVFLEAVGVKLEQFPKDSMPEVAFAGKSSLINAMVNRKAIARTSQNPGKTRTINFYNVEDILYFVDLPGYGYARAPKSEMKKWGDMIEGYLKKRKTLKAIVLLIDIRHEPSENDRLMYEWLKYYGYKIIIAATKSDKLKRSQIKKHITAISKELNLAGDDIILPFSSETKEGREQLWDLLEEVCSIG